jgi:cytochrome c oxidase subunit 1
LLGASFLIFIANFVWTIIIDPRRAPDNPWDSNGLEWQTPNPVPYYNFDRIPIVTNDPYHYGEAEAVPVADLGSGVETAGVSTGGVITDTKVDPRPPIV